MYQDLLNQAETLARIDTRGKPKQANLRRAVSAAYYSLFHFLVEEVCRGVMGTQHTERGYRQSLARAFVHSTMKDACKSFAGGQLPKSVERPLPKSTGGGYVVSKPIQNIAAIFVDLQEERHLADYDLSKQFKRSDVLALIEQTAAYISTFSTLPASHDRQFFLVCLLTWKELRNR